MEAVFWASLVVILYTVAVYPAAMALIGLVLHQPLR